MIFLFVKRFFAEFRENPKDGHRQTDLVSTQAVVFTSLGTNKIGNVHIM
jgi:hypothetical protein